MLRRSVWRRFKNPYKAGGARDQNKSSGGMMGPSGDGNIGVNFEELASKVQRNMPFKVSENMYDRAAVSQYNSNPAYADKVNTNPTENRTGSGAGIKAELNDMVDPTKKSQMAWERIYHTEDVQMSQLSPEYYYPPPPPKEAVQRQRRFQMQVAIIGSCMLFTGYLLYRITPGEFRFWFGGYVGNHEPGKGPYNPKLPGSHKKREQELQKEHEKREDE